MGDPLHSLLQSAVAHWPDRVALVEPNGPRASYRTLAELSDRMRDRLRHLGVGRGDRVGVYMRKSIDAVAAIFGILKAGAAYVPVDPDAPPARCAYILNDCSVKVVILEERLAEQFAAEVAVLGPLPTLLRLRAAADSLPVGVLLDQAQASDPAPAVATDEPGPDDLAYILYTSGSTGRPKGVMLSHQAATSFVAWCSEVLRPTERDVFSSHAPFHFDLSILDIYVSLKHGATLVLIDDGLAKDPLRLAAMIAEQGISVWYSVPSILNFLAHYGKLDRYDFGRLRLVLFAGEVFPIAQLRALKALWPHARYLNLYGPTETNVCTGFELPSVLPADRTDPFPIGHACAHLRCRVVDPGGTSLAPGEEGELVVAGPGVMSGYWKLTDLTAQAFLTDADGAAWYRTGDLVVETVADGYVFHGRRDRMVKRRGYRVELGEIEAGLAVHPDVREVAVVAASDSEAGVVITAYLSLRDGATFSPIRLKMFSAERLPKYMIPDVFSVVPALPRTSTGKIDYQTLTRQE